MIAHIRDDADNPGREADFTDAEGVAHLRVDTSVWAVDTLVVIPRSRFWSRVLLQPPARTPVDYEPLPAGPTGWWHDVLGDEGNDEQRGAGIRVGVIDTGVGPNGSLAHVSDLGAFVAGIHDKTGGADIKGHGTVIGGSPPTSRSLVAF